VTEHTSLVAKVRSKGMPMRLVHRWGARAKHAVLMRLPSSMLMNTCNQLMGLCCRYPAGLASSKCL